MNARYYESAKGSFISQDPVFWEIGTTQDGKSVLLNPQSQNTYSYALNNPILYSDKSGRCAGPVALLCAAGVEWIAAGGLTATLATLPLWTSQMGQATETLNNPNASTLDKGFAAMDFVPMVGGSVKGEAKGAVKAGEIISKNADSLIQITKDKLGHVVQGHAWNSLEEGSSKFLKGVDPVKLVNEAAGVRATLQKSTGNYIRTIKNETNIGIDKVTKKLTDTYTVITKTMKDGSEKLITTFPSASK